MWHLMLVWWDGEGVCIAHILLPKHHEKHSWDSKMNTLPHISCTDLFCPTQDCELATYVHAHTHTSIQGASVTVNCDNNEWKPVLPPLLFLAVYYCVPPSLFLFFRFNLYQKGVNFPPPFLSHLILPNSFTAFHSALFFTSPSLSCFLFSASLTVF